MENSFTDQQLLSLMAENDREAFEIIYHRYWHLLYDAAFRRLKNRQQSEDIVQEIFVRLWERRSELKVGDLSAYLHTAVRYKIYNYISRNVVSETFYEPFEIISVCPTGADARILEKELYQLLDAYINTLPKKRQRIFTLYLNENLSTREIATRLNISQKTVQNQLGLAINGLKTRMLPAIISLIVLISLYL